MKHPAKMQLDDEVQQAFLQAIECHICYEELGKDRVRSHCHITGKYHGAAYIACYLKLRTYAHKTKILVVIHNLRGYGGHFIMAALGTSEATEGEKI